MGSRGKHAVGTRISDGEEENNKVVGREEARRTGRGLFPFPRASVGSFSTPALGRGRRRREEVQIIAAAATLVARSPVASSAQSSCCYILPTPVIYPTLIVRASRLCSLFPLLFVPPR